MERASRCRLLVLRSTESERVVWKRGGFSRVKGDEISQGKKQARRLGQGRNAAFPHWEREEGE